MDQSAPFRTSAWYWATSHRFRVADPWIVGLFLGVALAFLSLRVPGFPFPSRQVNKSLLNDRRRRTSIALVYGVDLGTGFTTYIGRLIIVSLAILAISIGSSRGLLVAGITFGVARILPTALWGAVMRSADKAQQLEQWIVSKHGTALFNSAASWTGIVLTVGVFAVVLLEVLEQAA